MPIKVDSKLMPKIKLMINFYLLSKQVYCYVRWNILLCGDSCFGTKTARKSIFYTYTYNVSEKRKRAFEIRIQSKCKRKVNSCECIVGYKQIKQWHEVWKKALSESRHSEGVVCKVIPPFKPGSRCCGLAGLADSGRRTWDRFVSMLCYYYLLLLLCILYLLNITTVQAGFLFHGSTLRMQKTKKDVSILYSIEMHLYLKNFSFSLFKYYFYFYIKNTI